MINKDIEQVTKDDLQTLVDNAVLERKTLEYKQALPSNSDSAKKEFLADVSSFANASGGDLIFGITENKKTGAPKSLDGLSIENPDQEILRLENTIRDGIEPRIPSISTRSIPLDSAKVALIIRVPKSWSAPHRVIWGGHDKFFSRSSNGKYPLDVGELLSLSSLFIFPCHPERSEGSPRFLILSGPTFLRHYSRNPLRNHRHSKWSQSKA
ncbi:MAG: hypothetical protein GH159_00605 [Dehalococcoidia bacterium]|nr:hypothetical protein [Dehalococcoidia bacterium]